MKLQCRTLFDCTFTGVTGNYRSGHTHFVDRSGRLIDSITAWNFARNQQRNWETLLQMISLRTQPTIVCYPHNSTDMWEFEFEIENIGVYSLSPQGDNIDILLAECHGIPMIVGLTETTPLEPNLVTTGSTQNIWFKTINK